MHEIGLPFDFEEVSTSEGFETMASSLQTFGEVMSLNLSAGPALEPKYEGSYPSSTTEQLHDLGISLLLFMP